MPIKTIKQGYEGQILYGAAGTTATTLLTNVRDITNKFDVDKGDTTVRGDSTAPPIETQDVTIRKASFDWEMLDDINDAALEAMSVAATDGTPVAIRTRRYSSGKGFDGDVTLSMEDGEPLRGEATIKFTATPTRSYGRDPILYT